jgi:hypothetical protein
MKSKLHCSSQKLKTIFILNNITYKYNLQNLCKQKQPLAFKEAGPVGGKVTTSSRLVKLEVLTTDSVKMVLFWVVAPCRLVEVYRRFRGACCLRHQEDRRSKTSVNFYPTTRCNNPEDSHLQVIQCWASQLYFNIWTAV